MTPTLAATAFLMGLAGGPHCAAMCGAACVGIAHAGHGSAARRAMQFQVGRLLGYSAAGAVVASAAQALAWLVQHTAVLKPAWALMHVVVLGWGLSLLVMARQPVWLDGFGRSVWGRVRPWAGARGGAFGAGALWTFMPCGLLYSALLVASLAGDSRGGALSMALFAAGSGLGLWLAPRLFHWLSGQGNRWRQAGGTRVAGAILVVVAVWALWADTMHRIAQWCGL
ncbi:sulfite exporter TauE/SafE family protein [Ramlibacter humi]|uniref:Sulfite exporter TauE/SafE family protein n=1 Tax=Ramlibacter humi TaxID=2530451 RepID=A0A4Z0CAC6_9BURK|nr:sulfite exporter TauE/SafE family protein [Ramlibacter humi]TFZ07842.1 sulfite exporter TauE/SafE family protein [Ramlibacter humi]